MNGIRIIIMMFLFSIMLSCTADVNVSKCEINVKQGDVNIPCETGYFDFGNLPINLYQSITFVIENQGLADLKLTGNPRITISSGSVTDFAVIDTQTATVILPGEQTTFNILFNPKSLGEKYTTVTITNNDEDEKKYEFKIIGTCTPPSPEIHIQQDNNDILSMSGSYDFGVVNVGSESDSVTFTVFNNGNEDLIINPNPKKVNIGDKDSSMFNINQNLTILVIPASDSTTFEISFQPTSSGHKQAKISIYNNDSDENPYTFMVYGTGKVIPEINVKEGSTDIPSSTEEYDFVRTFVNETSPEIIFTIENQGLAPLHLTKSPNLINISGTDASLFTINESMTSDIVGVGGSTTFTIKFSPLTMGIKTASITIVNNDLDENPYTFNIKGTGLIYRWTKQLGVKFTKQAKVVTTDLQDNVYISGYFNGTINFASDFGGTDNVTSKGFEDIFLTKINSNGTYAWTKRLGGTGIDYGKSVVVDSIGNIYLTGRFSDTVDFGEDFSSTDIKTSKGDFDVYLTKILANGSYGWTKQFGGSKADYGYALACDSNDNIYISGWFQSDINFGEDFSNTDIRICKGSSDLFVSKILANGSYGWTKQFGGSYETKGGEMTTDSSNNIYITGYFGGTVDFAADFGSSNIITSVGLYDIFITRINNNGNYGWTKRIGGMSRDFGRSIIVDSSNNIFVTGSFEDTCNFGADFGASDTKSSEGECDIFITKLTTSGTYKWTKTIGGNLYDVCYSIILDLSENIYITGHFNSKVNFGKDFSTQDYKTSAGYISYYGDIFITKILSNGTYGWTKRIGGSADEIAYCLRADTKGNIYILGSFFNYIDFGEDFYDCDQKNSFSGVDIFLTKLSP